MLALPRAVIIEDDRIEGLRIRMWPVLASLWPVVTPTAEAAMRVIRITGAPLAVLRVTAGLDKPLREIATLRREGFDAAIVASASLRSATADRALREAGATAVFDSPPDACRFFECLSEAGVVTQQRSDALADAVVRLGCSVIDLRTGVVLRGDAAIELSGIQKALLVSLLRRRGGIAPREALSVELWDDVSRAQGVDRHVSALRTVLGDPSGAPQHLFTIPKVGYRLEGAQW